MSDADYNVNVIADLTKRFLPCILCGMKLFTRIDKNDKPYFMCDPCGIQMFIRRPLGIERLRKLISQIEKNQDQLRAITARLTHFQSLIAEYEQSKTELAKVENRIGIIFANENDIHLRDALQKRIKSLVAELHNLPIGK